jgi:hypothetical protein
MFKNKRFNVVSLIVIIVILAVVLFFFTLELHAFLVLDGQVLGETYPKVVELRKISKSRKDIDSSLREIVSLVHGTDYEVITILWPRYLAPKRAAIFLNNIVPCGIDR